MLPRKNETVLIVEDEPDLRYMLALNLECEGYRALVTASREDGLMVAREHKPAVIISNLFMPGMGIDEFVAEIRRLEPAPCLVFISASDQVAEIAQRHGVPYLRKPFEISDLQRCFNTEAMDEPKH
jgi:CheY-like chemotaxis protein